MLPGFFVTGTNTEIGKTYVTSLLAAEFVRQGKSVGVYKPVASGCRKVDGQLLSDDAVALWNAAGQPRSLHDVTPQLFKAALAPNVAARHASKSVDRALIRDGLNQWKHSDIVLVEGVGGLMSPITDEDLVLHVAVDFALPLILVVGNELGCINSTLLTLNVARQAGLDVTGIYLNDCQNMDESADTNLEEIQRLTNHCFVRRVSHNATQIDASGLTK